MTEAPDRMPDHQRRVRSQHAFTVPDDLVVDLPPTGVPVYCQP